MRDTGLGRLDADPGQEPVAASAGSHQLALPKRCISEGTRSRAQDEGVEGDRRPPGRCRTWPCTRTPLSAKARKTEIMITAAELITRLVSARPTRTARALSPVSSHSSYIRLTRKTW